MKKFLKIGVIGLGEQAWDNLLPSLTMIPYIRIVAVCDINPDRARLVSESYGIKSFSNYVEMLDSTEIDIVVAATFPQIHYLVAKECIQRKIPFFIEKPPTLTTNELIQLIELNRLNKVPSAVGLNFNFAEPISYIRQILKDKSFGELSCLKISHFGSKPNGTLWGLSSRNRSFLLAQAIHALGLLFIVGDQIENLHVDKTDDEYGLFFNVHMLIRSSNQRQPIIANITTTSKSPFFEWRLELFSVTGAMITLNSLWELEYYTKDNKKWWRQTWRPSPLTGGFKRTGYEPQFDAFFSAVQNNEELETSIERMLPIYRLIDEMEQANGAQVG